MAYLDVRFPKRIALGVSCEPGWDVTIVSTLAGEESRNLNWQDARHEYDAAQAVGTLTEYHMVLEHFHQARSKLHKFRLRDPLDHTTEIDQGIVILEDTVLQLYKQYGTGSLHYDRRITRPYADTVSIYNSGVLADPSSYTLDIETGQLVFAGATAANLSWTGEFDVPVRYDIPKLPARGTNKHKGELTVELNSLPLVEVRE